MTAGYRLRVGETRVLADGRHEAVCRCTCGWSVTLPPIAPHRAAEAVARAGRNHHEDVHERGLRGGANRVDPHPLVVAGDVRLEQDGVVLRQRYGACGCGWVGDAVARTGDRAARIVEARHRRHVDQETGRTPARDWLVLLAVLLVVGAVMIALTGAVIGPDGA